MLKYILLCIIIKLREVIIMPPGKNNQQIAIVLPKEIIKELDELANEEVRTRSQQCAKIIIDYLKAKKEKGICE